MNKKNNFEKIKECITTGQLEDISLLSKFMDLASESYVLITFPDVQDYMEEEWFDDEAVLDNSDNAESSSYFIPLVRIL